MTPTISTSTQKNTNTPIRIYTVRRLFNTQNELDFKPVTPEVMPLIWRYLIHENGRTCDFSYGGLLMWTPLFDYEYAIFRDTLYIKGKLEGDMSKYAFSLPLGALSVEESFDVLKRWCDRKGHRLRFSAIPEYALEQFEKLNPSSIKELPSWADYMYDIVPLATLSGKKMAKKRNHVNKFEATYPNHEFKILTKDLLPEMFVLLEKISAESDDQSEMAKSERQLCAKTLELMQTYNLPMIGGVLFADGSPTAFTVGDIKHDTLYIHIEKALRSVPGAYEAINKYFAEAMLEYCPSLRYINREDDAGSPGLRYAKESYHPIELLKKYDIIF